MREDIRVAMIRPSLHSVPSYPLPKGYRCRFFKPGETLTWAQIECAAGEFASVAAAASHFEREFGPFAEELTHRCLFLEEPGGRAVGTATAWYNPTFLGEAYGRLHWVAIHPDFQGRHLGKPLVSAALAVLAERHPRAYLTSQTSSVRAIGIYLDLGFEPLLKTPRWEEAWGMLAASTQHPALLRFLAQA